MGLLELIEACGASRTTGGMMHTASGRSIEVIVDPQELKSIISAERSLLVVHTKSDTSNIDITVAENGCLNLTEVFLGDSFAACAIHQTAGSRCEVTCVAVSSAIADYNIDLDGRGAENTLRAAFIVGDAERTRIKVNVNHNVADCKSNSLIKGVAGGRGEGEFEGLVYVAPDAQRTDARQTSRNIELGRDAHITTKPQLEIYADDVKCSHGATVGQLDGDAVMYMRQRGLSESQARRLQIEGFVSDIVLPSEDLGDALAELLTSKLEKL